MRREAIRTGEWYETQHGVGQCKKAGGCFPWAAEVHIIAPMPLGPRTLKPGQFLRRLGEAEVGRYVGAEQLRICALGSSRPAIVREAAPELTDLCACGHDFGSHDSTRKQLCSWQQGELSCACLGFKPAGIFEQKIRRTIHALLAELPRDKRRPLLQAVLLELERATVEA